LSIKKSVVSGLLIVQNEERYLARALAQLKPIVDELVVIDGGSIDDTVKIAENFGARVFIKPFAYDFAAQRNFGIEKCLGEWILTLDADEYFEEAFSKILPSLLTRTEIELYRFRRDNVYLLDIPHLCFRYYKWFFHRYDYQEKLFRRHLRYEGTLHEKIVGSPRVETRKEKIIHDKSYRRQQYSDRFYAELMVGNKKHPNEKEGGFNLKKREWEG
jgi:glycosyltransferase involved in cell wall biosynthesis